MKAFLIKKPVITEKSLQLAKKENKYVFLVERNANKDQILAAIEEIFGVEVLAVNTIKAKKGLKKTGKKRLKISQQGGKKAIVHLKAGQKIDLFDFDQS